MKSFLHLGERALALDESEFRSQRLVEKARSILGSRLPEHPLSVLYETVVSRDTEAPKPVVTEPAGDGGSAYAHQEGTVADVSVRQRVGVGANGGTEYRMIDLMVADKVWVIGNVKGNRVTDVEVWRAEQTPSGLLRTELLDPRGAEPVYDEAMRSIQAEATPPTR
jgi:hypothetical protein